MTNLTVKEVAEAVKKTPERIRQMHRQGIIQGEMRGGALFFLPGVITVINNRPETRGRKKGSAKTNGNDK